MRVSTAFLKVIINAPKQDQILEIKHKGKLIKMRVVKFDLESGEKEILISNIFDENFTGETPIAIEQDSIQLCTCRIWLH